jgi:hypothetical protein
VKRLLAALGLLVAAAVPATGANFNDTSSNAASVTAESIDSYVRLWSQDSDPNGLTGYATKHNSAPPVPAATGADTALTVALGGFKNSAGQTVTRVLTLQAPNPLPAGSSPITVSGALVADAATGRQPLTGFTFSPLAGTPTSSTVTLTAGQKVQLNVSVRMKGSDFPGNNQLYTPAVALTVRYPGYSGSFLTYKVPMSAWDGNGAGP